MGNKGTREKWVDNEFKAAIALKVQQGLCEADFTFVDQYGANVQFLVSFFFLTNLGSSLYLFADSI
jgi:hypothetical protein